jgi:cysteinyl-tRNA synthetase
MNPTIKLFNTLNHKQENFTTIEPNILKMYVCGPTVYDRPHLGNARSIVIYDLFFRFFKAIFSEVIYVRNITDIDDKINAAAKERRISIQNLTQEIINFFYSDIEKLNVLKPSFEPKATENISEIIAMIQKLIKNGNAYENEGHVLFDVKSYDQYGVLSNRNIDEMISGSRVEIASYKKDPLDFVLWKPADNEDDVSSIFESPWGSGRPGWHIECSAMSSKYLGADFDIHGGGADLQFPHHENEIAQSRCANPHSHFAKFWIHNGFLTVNGEKMSKSLKNFITVQDLLNQGVSGIVIRYFLLSAHYRKPLDFNQKALDDAKKAVEKFHISLQGVTIDSTIAIPKVILEYLSDDLNFAKIVSFLHENAKELKSKNDERKKKEFAQVLDFLGLFDQKFLEEKKSNHNFVAIDEKFILSQIELRLKFKQEKNFSKADEIRQNLLLQGIILEDLSKEKTIWKRK